MASEQDQMIEETQTAKSYYTLHKREHKRWQNSVEGMFTCISYIFGIGNVLIFPYYCGIHGGGAFLIPVVFVYIFVGFPITYIELALGQFSSISPHRIFKKLSLPFTGISTAMIFILSLRVIYFSSILSTSMFAAFAQFNFTDSDCHDIYKMGPCFDFDLAKNCTSLLSSPLCERHLIDHNDVVYNNKIAVTPHLSYILQEIYKPLYTTDDNLIMPQKFKNKIYFLGQTLAYPTLCLVAIWAAVGFLCYFGVRTIGKSAYVLATLPFILMFSMMVRSFFLEKNHIHGQRPTCDVLDKMADEELRLSGFEYFFTSDFPRLMYATVWVDAIIFVLFSVSLGDGGLMKIASHNNFTNYILRDSIIIIIMDFLMNLMSGMTFFNSVGLLANQIFDSEDMRCDPLIVNERMRLMLSHGNMLMMTAFPEAMHGQPDQKVWVFIHYFNLMILGMQSMVMSLDVILAAYTDKFPKLKIIWWKKAAVLIGFILFGLSLSYFLICPAGIYLILLLQKYSSLALVFICFFEVISVLFFYGFTRFVTMLQSMKQLTNSPIAITFFWLSLKFISVTIFVAAVILKMMEFGNIKATKQVLGRYIFPDMFEHFGWVACGSVIFLIITVLLLIATKYCVHGRRPIRMFLPRVEWEPLLDEDKKLARDQQLAIGIPN